MRIHILRTFTHIKKLNLVVMKRVIFDKRLVLLAVVSLFLVACGNVNAMKSRVQIELGMTKDQATEIMGTPGSRQFVEGYEAWQYCKAGAVNTQNFVIWFKGDVVFKTSEYRSFAMFNCQEGFRQLELSDMPK